MKTIIIEVPDSWVPGDCYICKSVGGINPACRAKEAVEVRFDVDKETGLSVIDKNNVFHFEGQDKYYAVKENI